MLWTDYQIIIVCIDLFIVMSNSIYNCSHQNKVLVINIINELEMS